MKVSFVILNWNTKDWLVKLFSSVKEFKPSVDHEFIVIDQGSKDGSLEYLKTESERLDNLSVIKNDENLGISKGRAQGVEVANGDFILFCDSDIEFCEPYWLEAMLLVMEQNPDCGAVGPYTSFANQQQQKERDGAYQTRRLDGSQQLMSFCMLVPTELADEIHWDYELSIFTDTDWIRRMINQGWMPYIAPTYVIHHGRKSFESNEVDICEIECETEKQLLRMWRERTPNLNWCDSVVIWLDSGLGNAVLTLPFLKALRTFAPHLRIDIHSPRGSKLIEFCTDLYDNLSVDQSYNYDICFKMVSSSQPYVPFKWLLEVEIDNWIHSEAEAAMNLLRQVGYSGGTPRVSIDIEPFDFSDKMILLHTGSYDDAAKEWPIKSYLKVAKYFINEGYSIGILGGLEEYKKAQNFVDSVSIGKNDTVAYNLAGADIEDTLSFITGASLIISNDSGIMHLAGLTNTPQVCIFGYTNPVKNSPLNTKAVILQSDRSCVPCYGMETMFPDGSVGNGPCPTRDCLYVDITPDDVVAAAVKIL